MKREENNRAHECERTEKQEWERKEGMKEKMKYIKKKLEGKKREQNT